MKKAALISFTCLIMIGLKAQVPMRESIGNSGVLRTASTSTLVVDTLHYYLNKHFFKTGKSLATFPNFKSPSPITSSVSHCGSRFDVPAGETVTVTGLEVYASMPIQGHHANTPIPLTLYLCYLNNNGLPEFPILDSVSGVVGFLSVGSPSLVGGNFSNSAVYTMTNNFAVLVRDVSPQAGDTVHIYRTEGAALTSAADPKLKYSDGYGFVRYGGVFYKTTDFTAHPGFGVGTDYEFLVAPRVKYEIRAGHLASQGIVLQNDNSPVDTMCTRQTMTFTNTSSAFYTHRIYNLNAFHSIWKLNSPFPPATSGIFSPDSAITWNFEFYDSPHHIDSRVFLPYLNNGTITAITDTASFPDCFKANEFRARLRPMGAFAKKPQYIYNEGFTVCLKYCFGDGVGITDLKPGEHIRLFPNPALNGKSILTGLSDRSTLLIYSSQGVLLDTLQSENASAEINLKGKPNGVYFVKVLDRDVQSASFKLIKFD